jgi:hypothetical protein
MSSNGRKREKLALDPDHVSTCFVTVVTLDLFRSKHSTWITPQFGRNFRKAFQSQTS